MKKKYSVPDIETVKFALHDVVLNSPTESTIPEAIGGDGEGSDLGGLLPSP